MRYGNLSAPHISLMIRKAGKVLHVPVLFDIYTNMTVIFYTLLHDNKIIVYHL